MYNAVVNWIKENLIYTTDYKSVSDREYSRQVCKTVKGYNNTFTIYETRIAPEESLLTMDVEIGGKHVQKIEATHSNNNPKENKPHIILTNEKGDVFKQTRVIHSPEPSTKALSPKTQSKTDLTYKELTSQECTQKQVEIFLEEKREKEQSNENAEILELPLPFRSIGETSSLTNLHNLMEQCPQPQPPLINKQIKTLQLNANQAIVMAEQVQRMKTGMERLQDIIKKFNCTERFKQDIDFIIANVGPAIVKAEQMRSDEQTVSSVQKEEDLHKEKD